ncbi:hypothetical protein DFJ74DRAFT_436980 [Hyaloraphidium curvatum]|nr:hypothetical protein DFJ74DRAFT_436980 [Hyaloraphidium curvatum]
MARPVRAPRWHRCDSTPLCRGAAPRAPASPASAGTLPAAGPFPRRYPPLLASRGARRGAAIERQRGSPGGADVGGKCGRRAGGQRRGGRGRDGNGSSGFRTSPISRPQRIVRARTTPERDRKAGKRKRDEGSASEEAGSEGEEGKQDGAGGGKKGKSRNGKGSRGRRGDGHGHQHGHQHGLRKQEHRKCPGKCYKRPDGKCVCDVACVCNCEECDHRSELEVFPTEDPSFHGFDPNGPWPDPPPGGQPVAPRNGPAPAPSARASRQDRSPSPVSERAVTPRAAPRVPPLPAADPFALRSKEHPGRFKRLLGTLSAGVRELRRRFQEAVQAAPGRRRLGPEAGHRGMA